MKPIKNIFTVVVVLASMSDFALTETVDGIKWKYKVTNGEACVVGDNSLVQEGSYWRILRPAIPESTSGSISIPSTLGGYPVTSIGKDAFWGCDGLTSVTIPDRVTDIGNMAFYACTGLTSVMIPCHVTNIGSSAFSACIRLTSMTIPNSVANIGDSAFSGCRSLTNVTIPNSVTNIGVGAFEDCGGLIDVTIPDSMRCIESSTFQNCTNLTSVTIGSGATRIGEFAFSHCSSLSQVTIPDSMRNIEASAFGGCTNLTSVQIGNGVTNIGKFAFSHCNRLTSVTIPDQVEVLGDNAFSGCNGLTNVVIGTGMMYIGNGAYGRSVFEDCSSLTSVTMSDNIVSIGYRTFYNCKSLKNLTLPCDLTYIDSYAFYGCKELTNMTIPDNVTSIGSHAFDNCTGLTNVTIGICVAKIYDRAFDGCSKLSRVNISDIAAWCKISFGNASANPLTYAHNLYLNGVLVKNMTTSDDVTRINDYAFYGCHCITNMEFSDNVTSIGHSAFYGCSELVSVRMSDHVTNIGSNAFLACRGLTSMTIPDGVTNIQSRTFYYCESLTNVVILGKVTNIGVEAFYWCKKLTDIMVPDCVIDIGRDAFYGTDFYDNLPDGLVILGRVLYNVKGLCPAVVTIPEGVVSIGRSAFYRRDNLTSVTIPNSVTSIGDYAFYYCTNMTNMVIGDGLRQIEPMALYGCNGLRGVSIVASQYMCDQGIRAIFPSPIYESISNIVISDGVTRIRSYAFECCSGLKSVTIPDSVTSIGYDAFDGFNSSLCETNEIAGVRLVDGWAIHYTGASAVLSGTLDLKGVRGIGDSAFSDCKGLTSVVIPDSVTHIGSRAFFGCSSLTNVTISSSVTSVGQAAFDNCNVGLYDTTTTFNVYAVDGWIVGCANSFSGELDIIGARGIAEGAFYNCTNLTCAIVPDSVRIIGAKSFLSCSKLSSVLFDGDAPIVGTDAFADVTADCHAYVRRTSDGWGTNIPGVWNGLEIDYLEKIVMFDANGGEGGTNSLLDIGTAIVTPAVSRTGYTFAGWSPSVAAVVPTNDVTYTAQWILNKYHVTFDANGGSGGWSKEMNYDTSINAPIVRRTGYAFNDWLPSVDDTVPASNVTYTAQWTPNKYSVTFNANGGEGGMISIQDYGTTIVEPMVTRAGYTFKGWSPSVAATVPANDITYTAQWEINKYTLTFNANGGTYGMATTTVEYGTTVGELPVPTRTNATFLGWFTAAEGGALIDGSTIITEAMTLCAHWLLLEEALDGGEMVQVATSATLPWKPVLDSGAKVGDAITRSGVIGDRTNTWLSATVEGAGTMSFWCKVSCEHDDDNTFTWDRLMVYTNDVEIVEWRMDGETDWTQRSLSFDGGTNVVKWVYFKDRSVSEGEDCAWVDGVSWTPLDVSVDVGGGKSVTVSMDWITAHENIVRNNGGDVTAALQATAANGRLSNVECYVLGLDPEDTTNDFKIVSFPMKTDGTPDLANIVFDPPPAKWKVPATYKVLGAATLEGPWVEVPSGGALGESALPLRFFKVIVELP